MKKRSTSCSAPVHSSTADRGAWFPAAISIALLAACSSGGGGGHQGGGSPPGSSTGRYHAFFGDVLSGGALNLVDPAAPGTHVPVAGVNALGFGYHPLILGTPDSAASTLRDVRIDRLHLAIGHRVVDLPLGIPAGAGGVREVATLGGTVGNIIAAADYSGPSLEIVYVVEAGSSHESFTRTGSSVTTPAPFPGDPVTVIGDRSDLSITGWLALDSGQLTRVDRNLQATNLAPATEARYVDVTDAGDSFLWLGDRFVCFTQSGTLRDVVFTPVAAGGITEDEFAVVGESALYFASPTGVGSFEIVRALPDGTAAAITGDIMGEPTFLNVSSTRVHYGFEDSIATGISLVSIDLTGGDAQALETGVASIDLGLFSSPGAAGGRIIYGLNGVSVVDVADDGSDRQVISPAALAGLSFAPTLSYGSALEVDSIFLTRPDGSGGTAVFSRLPGSAASLTELGVLAPEFTLVSIASLFTNTGVLTAQSATQSDVFIVTQGVAGSLRRVTDTASAFEIGVL